MVALNAYLLAVYKEGGIGFIPLNRAQAFIIETMHRVVGYARDE